jgi:hydrogenase expression/formation protein HypC
MCLAVPGKIVGLTEDPEPSLRRGSVDFAGVQREVSLAFTPEAALGDYVLVHVGFALGTVDEAEARRIFETLEEMEKAEALGAEDP